MLLQGVYYLLHMERGIYEYSELQQKFIDLNKRYQPFRILIEETTAGKALKRELRLPGGYLIKLQPIELDMKGRVYVLQSMFQEAIVRFPKDAPFMHDLESELLSYPYGRTDDIVDSIALAVTVGLHNELGVKSRLNRPRPQVFEQARCSWRWLAAAHSHDAQSPGPACFFQWDTSKSLLSLR
jgi:phage terminase large subunit-like protein